MSLATKHVATVAVAVVLVLGLSFAFAAPAKAVTVEELQAQITALLAQIAALQGGSTTTSGACFTFTRNHQQGDTGGEVMEIQKFLNKNGAQIAESGAGSPGNETSYFGALTRAAVAKFQAANGISPAAGYWGPITRAKANSMCTSAPGVPGTPGTPITGNGLKVMLASDSPTYGSLVAGQGIGELAKFTFQNPTGSAITVTNLAFKRIGVSNDSTLSNVYLFQGATRLTDAAGVSNTAFNFNAAGGIFTVPAGGSVTISVRSDIATGTSGEQVGVQLTNVSASAPLDSSVVLPISGSVLLISSATLATVDFNSTTLPSASSFDPQNDYTVWQNTVTVGTRAVWLQGFALRNLGSVGIDEVRNLRLYVDGVQVGQALPQMTAGEISASWDLTANPVRVETGGRVIKVVADVVGGSGDTMQFSLRRGTDARFVDTELNQPIKPTADSSTFSARSATSATIGSATVSLVKANNSPSAPVALNTPNVKWASFEVRASGEDVKIESLNVKANTSSSDDGLDNGKVFVNGVQVGSTKDLTENTNVEFTFGSSFIAKAGQVMVVDIYADAKDDDGGSLTSGETVTITIAAGSSNAFGQTSLTAINVPSSAVDGNAITVSSSSLTATKYSGYGNQTMVAGTSNARIGSFTLSTGSTEGVNVNTIALDLSSNEAGTITDLRLVNNATGAAIGTTKPSPSTSNTFSVNLDIPASSTMTIDIYANIKSSAGAGTIVVDVAATTGGTGKVTGSSVTVSAVSLQTITIGSATLTVTRDSGTPVNANVIAGSSNVHVGKFDFAAANSSFTVQQVKIKVPVSAATSVSNVTLKYKDAAGVQQTVTQALEVPSSGSSLTYATATFTGLTMHVPQNDSADLDVYVDVPTIANGAVSGAAISVLIDANEGFRAVDGSGTADTSAASSDVNSAASTGYGTMYVKKSVPVLKRLTDAQSGLGDTVAAGIGIYQFTVTADAAGTIDWRKIAFTITTSGVVMTDWTLYDITSGTAIAVNDTAANVSGSTLSICPDTSCTIGEAEEVGAGATKKYELRAATVSGWGGSGDEVTIYFTEDTSAVTNAAAASVSASMIWSDRSATSHATTTTDWTNGYLVKDMADDTRQCQFGTVTTCTP